MGAAAPGNRVREGSSENRVTTVPAPREAQAPECQVQKKAAFAETDKSYQGLGSHKSGGMGAAAPGNRAREGSPDNR